jgi:integrase
MIKDIPPLRDYQVADLAFMLANPRCGLLSDPGTGKTGRGRVVPLTQRAFDTLRSTLAHRNEVLRKRSLPSSRYVFIDPRSGNRMRSIHGWWYRLVEKAGLPGFRFHDLRHTFASWAIQRGVHERVVMAWLGHSTPSMTKRYAHLNPEMLYQAADKFSRGTKRDTHEED